MVSLPDYDPNSPKQANDPLRINRLTTGVFELGSTFKALTLAMALDSGKFNLNSMLDARGSLRYGKFNIGDYHGQNRVLTLPEVFTYSSNIGTARMALGVGVEHHKWFLKKLGQLDRLRTELPESAEPMVPKRWGELNTVTIAFGHGLSVAPLQAVAGINALVNGGLLIPPTFMKRSPEEAMKLAKQVVKPETSDKMRYLMRLNAEKGTATQGRGEGLLRRRQDRHLGKGGRRPLFQDQAAHHLHRDPAGRQAALSGADHARRAAGPARDPRLCHLRLERRADGGQGDRPHRADARHRAALRSAAGRAAYFGQRHAVRSD